MLEDGDCNLIERVTPPPHLFPIEYWIRSSFAPGITIRHILHAQFRGWNARLVVISTWPLLADGCTGGPMVPARNLKVHGC